jgi:ankyrin repeat protein
MGETPLHYAALEPIAAALLAAGADPDRKHFTMTPLVAATLAGHDEVARLIHGHSTRARAARISEQMRSLGLSYLSEADTEFMLAGTVPVDDPQHLFESSRAERRVEPDFPRTIFEGWIKQIDAARLHPLAELALQAGLPLFFDLNTPPEEILKAMSAAGAQRSGPYRRRTRRFAGDELLTEVPLLHACQRREWGRWRNVGP